MTTPAAAARYRRYRKSPKGRATARRVAKTPKVRAQQRRWDRSEKGRASRKRRGAKRSYHFSRYGIPFSARVEILAAQNGRCPACGSSDPGRKTGWSLHHTGSKREGTFRIHGLFCHRCNITIRSGTREDIDYLRRVADWCETQICHKDD
jgi:hypothetical protein